MVVMSVNAPSSWGAPRTVSSNSSRDSSRSVEFMAGAGPQLIHVFGAGSDTYGGVPASAHFMVWPRQNSGWFAAAEYEVAFPAAAPEAAPVAPRAVLRQSERVATAVLKVRPFDSVSACAISSVEATNEVQG